MKTGYAALASLAFLAITAPYAKADTLENPHTVNINYHMMMAGEACGPFNHITCEQHLELAGQGITSSIITNFDLIQAENTRIDAVEKSIDNVGALSAALGSVPAISADSPFTCGFGAGTHSSAYALSAGCASRVSERVSLNAALATVVNNHTGDKDDNLSARAGFTFKLGKIDDSPKVAARKAAALHDEVSILRDENAAIRNENASIRATSIEQQQLNLALIARLERLEAIALGQNPAITKVSLK